MSYRFPAEEPLATLLDELMRGERFRVNRGRFEGATGVCRSVFANTLLDGGIAIYLDFGVGFCGHPFTPSELDHA